MGQADLHLHSTISDGRGSPATLVRRAVALGLDVISITDHFTVDGSLEAARVASQEGLPIEVVIGEELSTRSGDLVGLYLHETIPSGLSLADALRAIHEQGGLALLPHPFVPHAASVSYRALRAALRAGERPDAIEVRNPTPAAKLVRPLVRLVARRERLAALGNSDAHWTVHLGTARSEYEGTGAAALRRAIEERTTRPVGTDHPLRDIWPILLHMPRYRRGVSFRPSDPDRLE